MAASLFHGQALAHDWRIPAEQHSNVSMLHMQVRGHLMAVLCAAIYSTLSSQALSLQRTELCQGY